MKRMLCLLASSLLVVTSVDAAGNETKKPNFVIILADDLGYGDLHTNNPERVTAMQKTLEKIIRTGQSTPGAPQKNDIRVV